MRIFRSVLLLAFLAPLGAPVALGLVTAPDRRVPAAVAERPVAAREEVKPVTLASLVGSHIADAARLAGDAQAHCLAQVVYFEARSEALEGQLAVAQVVLNRVASARYPSSICAVAFQNEHLPFRCQFSFACDGMPDKAYNMAAWRQARAVAQVALDGSWADLTGQSTHYHALNAAPYWSRQLTQTVQLGRHIFYREDRS